MTGSKKLLLDSKFQKYIINSIIFLLPFLLAFFVYDLRFNNDTWLKDDNIIEINEKYKNEEFLNNKKSLIVKIKLTDSFFEQKNIEDLRNLVSDIEKLDYIHLVKSPLHVSHIINDNDLLTIENFDQLIDLGVIKNLSDYRRIFLKSDYALLLLSKNYRQFIIEIKTIIKNQNKQQQRKKIIKEVSSLIDNYPKFNNYQFAGRLYLNYQLNEVSGYDFKKLFIISISTLLIILYLIYRNFTKLFITLYPSLIAILVSLIVIKLHSGYLTAINIILPLIILSIAISDAVHILSKWKFIKVKYSNKPLNERITKLIKLSYKPCLITSITTAIGFGSFYFSDIIPLKNLAIESVIVILISYLIIVIVSWLLIYLNHDKLFISGKYYEFTIFKNKIPLLVNNVNKYRYLIIILTVIFSSYFIYGFSKIYTESNFVNIFFKKNSQIYKTFTEIDKNLSGSGEIDLILKNKKDFFKNIDNMSYVNNLTLKISQHYLVRDIKSYINSIQNIHKKITNDQSNLPIDNKQLEQELLFLEFSRDDNKNDILSEYINFDYSTARINIKTDNLNSAQIKELITDIRNVIGDNYLFVGSSIYFYKISNYINHIQLKSVIITFTIIFLLMLIFYNFKTAIMSVILNSIPVIITAGIIAHLNISFDFATVLISAIAFAIAIDNSIHLIDNYKNFKDEKISVMDRIINNLEYISYPLIINTILFSAIFLIFIFAELVLLVKFGFFSFIAILLAFLTNIILSNLFFLKQTKSSHSSSL